MQRLLEFETYRTLALLGLPVARRAGPELARMEAELSEVTQEIAKAPDPSRNQRMLQKLTRLAAEIEAQSARTAFRFGASRAYYALVRSRIELIRERQEGEYVTITAFFRRRLEPAIETCNAVEARQARLSSQLARTADLLRTGIQFELEHQNRDLLTSMDKRAQLQLRLQQTVEGLSVATISYLRARPITYVAKGVKDAGLLPKPLTPGRDGGRCTARRAHHVGADETRPPPHHRRRRALEPDGRVDDARPGLIFLGSGGVLGRFDGGRGGLGRLAVVDALVPIGLGAVDSARYSINTLTLAGMNSRQG